MPELPNLLRQRLAAAENGVAQTHPDADTLTAYTEHALSAVERQTVVAHLSVCGPCREVVALSQPQIAEAAVQQVLTPAPVPAWRKLFTPAFGLAATVAAMAIIAILVLQLPQKSVQQSSLLPTQETKQAKATSLGDVASPEKTNESLPAQPVEARPSSLPATSTAHLDVAVPVTRAQIVQLNEGSPKVKAAAGLIGAVAAAPQPKTLALASAMQKKDYVNTNFFANGDSVVLDGQSRNDFPSAPQPQTSSSNAAFVARGGKITIFSDIPAANTDGKSTVSILTPAPPPEHAGCVLCKMATATARTLHLRATTNPAFRAGTLGNSALGGPGMFSDKLAKSQSAEVSAAPEKTEGGSLARSDALSSSAMSVSNAKSLASAPTVWKVAGGKLIKSVGPSQWEDAYPVSSSTLEFSFVSARGADVWAGGTHAALIHSRDGGSSWETVKLGDAATGTIVGIFTGGLTVQVKTSDNQNWLSTDGGQSWSLKSE